MSWAKYAKEALQRGESATIHPRGSSMTGKVNDGATVVLSPCYPHALSVADLESRTVDGLDEM